MKSAQGFILVVLSLLCLELYSQSAVCAYKYRKRITFDPALVSGSSDLVNFPALINITSDNDLRTVANSGHVEQTNGYDIIFTADDGVTKLDHQLERYTNTTGELVAWVRIPNLSTTYSTTIYMYYGNTAISADQSVNTTWASAYKGVWHLNNNVFTDGTSNGNNGTNSGSTNTTTAKIAGGRVFGGADGNYLQVGLSGMSSGSGNGSVSLWGRITTYETSTYFFGETSTQDGSYNNRIQLYTGNATGRLDLGLGGNHTLQTGIQTLALNTWYHIALTWSTTGSGTGNYSVFVNGAQLGASTYTNFTAIHTSGDLGNDGNAGQRDEAITGHIDEVHTTNTTLSSGWIQTEYNNQNSPSTFYSVSAEPKVWTGGTNTNYNAASNWLSNNPAISGDDVIIHSGTNQPDLQASEQLNSLFIRTGATLSLITNSLSIRRDISNCGVISGTAGVVVLNSTSSFVQTQNISGSGTYNLGGLVINNTHSASPTIVLNKDVNVSGALTLTSGIVYTTATNILALGTGATSSSGSSSSFVSGPISKTGTANFVFPIGKGTSWRRAAVSNITASSTFTAEYFNSVYTNTSSVNSPMDNVSKVEYWQVDRSGTGNANLSLYWESAQLSGITDCSDLTIARWNGSSWDERPATTVAGSTCSTTGTGTITTNAALTAFSPFTFGSKLTSQNPLPVELIEFKAICSDRSVLLNWITVGETEKVYYILEKSEDGTIWEKIKTLAGMPTGAEKQEYSFSDQDISNGMIYYKLSHLDILGHQKTFKAIGVDCSVANVELKIYPNPSANEFYLEFDLSQNNVEGQAKVIDNLGKTCYEQTLNGNKGTNNFKITPQLPPGSYMVLVSFPGKNFTPRKLMIN
jgi:hypothetical protein